jgi:hypothetical protein
MEASNGIKEQDSQKLQCSGTKAGSGSFGCPGCEAGSVSRRYAPDPSIIKQKSKKSFYFYCFVTFL